MNLVADSLITDPQLVAAKQEILKTIERHRKTIITTRPAQREFKNTYSDAIEQMHQLRGAPLFYPYLGSGMGNGALVELGDGSVKYDMIAGIGVHFGHLHPRVVEAHLDAAMSDLVMQGNLMQNRETLTLLELLTRTSGLPHCFLSTSGAMANENALKIAFQKKPHATRILAFERCFAGRTWSLSQLTDKGAYREGLPLNIGVDYLPFYDWQSPEKSGKRALDQLKIFLHRYPKGHACMCFELIQGEGGYYAGETSFFKPIMELLKEHEIAIWADEVQTFGRTDHLFAFQHFELDDFVDIVTVGKLLQTCAMLYRTPFTPRPGLLSQTFTASTAMILSATTILQCLLEEGFLGPEGKNCAIRKRFLTHFERLATKHPNRFEGPYGAGTMLAFTPYGGEKKEVIAFLHRLYEAGVIAFYCGDDPLRVRFLPPVGGMTLEDVDQVMHCVEQVL